MKFCSDESYAAAEKHEPIGLEHFLEQLKKAADRDRERDKEKMREERKRDIEDFELKLTKKPP